MYLERFSIQYCKTQPKAVTLADHNWHTQHYEPIQNSMQINVTGARWGKNVCSKSWLVLVLHLIGWENGTSFLIDHRAK